MKDIYIDTMGQKEIRDLCIRLAKENNINIDVNLDQNVHKQDGGSVNHRILYLAYYKFADQLRLSWWGDFEQPGSVNDLPTIIKSFSDAKLPIRMVLGNYTVEFHSDGSINVGCTTVSSAQFEEITRKRKEAMERGSKA